MQASKLNKAQRYGVRVPAHRAILLGRNTQASSGMVPLNCASMQRVHRDLALFPWKWSAPQMFTIFNQSGPEPH